MQLAQLVAFCFTLKILLYIFSSACCSVGLIVFLSMLNHSCSQLYSSSCRHSGFRVLLNNSFSFCLRSSQPQSSPSTNFATAATPVFSNTVSTMSPTPLGSFFLVFCYVFFYSFFTILYCMKYCACAYSCLLT